MFSNSQVIDLGSGVDHSVAVTRSGQVWSWGCAEQGQLGRVARFMSVRGGRRGLDTILAPQVMSNTSITGSTVRISRYFSN